MTKKALDKLHVKYVVACVRARDAKCKADERESAAEMARYRYEDAKRGRK